jgi:hypothetical protein
MGHATLCIPLRARNGSIRAYALVDEPDYGCIVGVPWCLTTNGYVCRREDGRITLLHRRLLGLRDGDPREGDHWNLDKLDNRRQNLRITTRSQNAQNLPHLRQGARFGRGVTLDPRPLAKPWVAQVRVKGRHVFYKRFATEGEAMRAAAMARRQHMTHAKENG